MTALSRCILTGYGILQIVFVIVLDRSLRKIIGERYCCRPIRWIWIIPYLAAAAVPAAVVFISQNEMSFQLQRFGNVFLAYDLHCAGLFLLASIVYPFVLRAAHRQHTGGLPLKILLPVFAAGVLIAAYGMHHAQETVVTQCTADLRTGREEGEHLRIALIADLHLGVNSHPEMTRRMVSLINEQRPDVVVVAGDVFTSSYEALRSPELYTEALSRIEAPMGVYAVYGNHDLEETLFGGFAVRPVSEAFRPDSVEQFFEDSGFTVLYDEVTEIADGKIRLAGRIDGNKAGDGTGNRLAAEELLRDIPPDKCVIVLEHEPVEYRELREAGADLVLSGHTHNGQIFPGNLFIRLINENGYGQKKLYGMETFVTSGVGTFGPPMRTAANSEIMIIDLLYQA